MVLTSDTAPADDACEFRSIVTDGTGSVKHWILCISHGVADLCEDPTCSICLKLGSTHGDTAAPTPF